MKFGLSSLIDKITWEICDLWSSQCVVASSSSLAAVEAFRLPHSLPCPTSAFVVRQINPLDVELMRSFNLEMLIIMWHINRKSAFLIGQLCRSYTHNWMANTEGWEWVGEGGYVYSCVAPGGLDALSRKLDTQILLIRRLLCVHVGGLGRELISGSYRRWSCGM